MSTNRIPVIWNDKPLMPMKWKKVKRLVEEGKAKFKYNKDGIRYLKLKYEPSGTSIQPINLGIDPGTHFDGISVVSSKCHHENLELIHNKTVKSRMDNRRWRRKVRRLRLWHRESRFDNRTSDKLVPTISSMVEFRINTIKSLLKLYPISRVIIEDVRYNHRNETGDNKCRRGSFFSQCELGKNKLYNFIRSLGLKLTRIRGYITRRVRIKLFGEDLKLKHKGSKSFYAHCLDSFALASIGLKFDLSNVNKTTRFINKIWCNRRELFKVRGLIGNYKCYFRYKKNGVKEIFNKLGRINISRVKPEGITKSNHPKEWIKVNKGRHKCLKYQQPTRYGGTIVKGYSKIKLPRGLSKKVIWNGNSYDINSGNILGYKNRNYKLIHNKQSLINRTD